MDTSKLQYKEKRDYWEVTTPEFQGIIGRGSTKEKALSDLILIDSLRRSKQQNNNGREE